MMRTRHRVWASDWLCFAMEEDWSDCEVSPEPVCDEDIDAMLAEGAQPLCWMHKRLLEADLHRVLDGTLRPLAPGMVPSYAEPAAGASPAGVCLAVQLSGGQCLQPALIVANEIGMFIALPMCAHHVLALMAWSHGPALPGQIPRLRDIDEL